MKVIVDKFLVVFHVLNVVTIQWCNPVTVVHEDG